MKHKVSIVVVICLAALLLCAYLYIRPTYIDISVPAIEMTPGVTDSAETSITIRGWYHRHLFGRAYIQLEALEFLSQEITPYEPEYDLTRYQKAPVVFTNVAWMDMELLQSKGCHIFWSMDQGCCAIWLGGNRVIVGSATGDYDSALALFKTEFYFGD